MGAGPNTHTSTHYLRMQLALRGAVLLAARGHAGVSCKPQLGDKPKALFFQDRKKAFTHRHLMVLILHYSLESVQD